MWAPLDSVNSQIDLRGWTCRVRFTYQHVFIVIRVLECLCALTLEHHPQKKAKQNATLRKRSESTRKSDFLCLLFFFLPLLFLLMLSRGQMSSVESVIYLLARFQITTVSFACNVALVTSSPVIQIALFRWYNLIFNDNISCLQHIYARRSFAIDK